MTVVPSPTLDLHPRWPADRFYWAELRVDLPERANLHSPAIRAVLEEAFEPHLPVTLDTVAAAYMKIGDGLVLACAIPASAIEAEAPQAITLTPASLPDWVQETPADVAWSLNVLTGPYLPMRVVRARRQRSLALAASIAVVGVLLSLGFVRRIESARRELSDARAVATAFEGSAAATAVLNGPAPLDQRVFGELSRLRATRSGAARAGVTDAAALLEPVLRRWPADARARASEVSVGAAGLSISAIVAGPAEADRLVTSFSQSPGWQTPRSEISSLGSAQRVHITMSPIGRSAQ